MIADELERRVDKLLGAHDPTTTETFEFRGAVFDAGLAWVHFPEGSGGCGAPVSLQPMVDELLADAGATPAPQEMIFGLALAGPTIVVHGSDELKRRTLRRMFTGEDIWCQLFSEPGAGSDLANVGSRAVRDGETWRVTGQKVWNTMAHLADKGMLLARSDPDQPKHRGLSYFMVDMNAAGVDVRPLRQITGEAEFNEVFLDEVEIPDTDRIGGIGEGWAVAMTTLMNERSMVGSGGGSGGRPRGSGPIEEAVRVWDSLPADRQPPELRARLADLWTRAEVLRLTDIRGHEARVAGDPGPETSVGKLMLAEINQAIYEYCVDALGMDGQVDYDFTLRRAEGFGLDGPPGSGRQMFLRSRANSIEGGTSEVMRNILGERVLGLAREPRPN